MHSCRITLKAKVLRVGEDRVDYPDHHNKVQLEIENPFIGEGKSLLNRDALDELTPEEQGDIDYAVHVWSIKASLKRAIITV